MEALSRKTEKEKLAELELILRDATWSGDVTDYASSTSFCSEIKTPTKHCCVPGSPRQDPVTNSPLAWQEGDWGGSGNVVEYNSSRTISMIDDSMGASSDDAQGTADCTARIHSSSFSSAEEVVPSRYRKERHHHRSQNELERRGGRHRGRATADHDDETAMVALLRSELKSTRSQLDQKEVVVKSLQRQLNQRGEIEAQTHARAEEDLVAALAKASGLKEELARTSQLLVDGALARRHLEQRCATVTQDLQEAVTRTAELEEEASISRAEVVRISGALHARRGTDVVDAERVFGEELERVQETATREARGLRQEVSALRTSLEQTKAKLRKACGDRDSWREEADTVSSEAATLRETVHALRQFSENETIDQLLGQASAPELTSGFVSRWKRRAEELENLQRVLSSPEPSAFDSSTSETNPNSCTGEADTFGTSSLGGNVPLTPVEQSTSPAQNDEDHDASVSVSMLRQQLCESRETLAMAAEELTAAELAVQDQTVKRIAAENRVKNLQREAEANTKAAREAAVARRAAKSRDMANLKIALRQDMLDELHKLQLEVRGQGEREPPHGAEREVCCTFDDGRQGPLRIDRACQVGQMIVASSGTGEGVEVRNDTSATVSTACSAGGADTADSTADRSSVVPSRTACAVSDDEEEKRISAPSASIAAVQAEAWASAFSTARQIFNAALVSLCEQACGVLAAQGDEGKRHSVLPVTGAKVSQNQEANSAVVPWIPGEAKMDAGTAVEVLRDSINSAVEYIRVALAQRALSARRPLDDVTGDWQITLGSSSNAFSRVEGGSQPAFAAAVTRATMGSQTEGKDAGGVERAPLVDVGVQAGSLGPEIAEAAPPGLGGSGGAPAWEGNVDAQRLEGQEGDSHRERQRKLEQARINELEHRVWALSNALQRADAEKVGLERSLTRRFEREQATLLEKQRHVYEADIGTLHASTMALVHDFRIGSAA
ncbi:unnamed protein product [Scytosiphon promiscuus]